MWVCCNRRRLIFLLYHYDCHQVVVVGEEVIRHMVVLHLAYDLLVLDELRVRQLTSLVLHC